MLPYENSENGVIRGGREGHGYVKAINVWYFFLKKNNDYFAVGGIQECAICMLPLSKCLNNNEVRFDTAVTALIIVKY